MAQSSYPTLSAARQHAYAMRVQRAWHYDNYDARRQAEIVERVKRLVAARPGSYLARFWREVYR
jgi:hypothetical protein